jgi:hypothetical protein
MLWPLWSSLVAVAGDIIAAVGDTDNDVARGDNAGIVETDRAYFVGDTAVVGFDVGVRGEMNSAVDRFIVYSGEEDSSEQGRSTLIHLYVELPRT